MDQFPVKVKTSAKDFFLYLATMAALYVSVVSLISLLFKYIDIVFPDVLYSYFDPYSTGVRLSIASLVIIFPLYIFLTRLANNDLRAHPEKKEIGVRKWLIYLTLFVAGIAVAIDLVTLVNTFLGGEITTRFVLKVLAVFVVVTAVFSYYWQDLKGKWEREERLSKTMGAISAFLVAGSIIAGFFIIGSPASQRLIRFDQEKIQHLQMIQSQIITFWQQKERFPKDLSELNDPLSYFTVPKDPQTKMEYEYAPGEGHSFTLCATFNQKSKFEQGKMFSPVDVYDPSLSNWDHESGKHCFERVLDPERFPPFRS